MALNRFNYFLLNDRVCGRWQLISLRADVPGSLDSHGIRRGVDLVTDSLTDCEERYQVPIIYSLFCPPAQLFAD